MLEHPNCVKFFGGFVQHKEVVIVMEYLKDGNLLSLLNKEGPKFLESQLMFM